MCTLLYLSIFITLSLSYVQLISLIVLKELHYKLRIKSGMKFSDEKKEDVINFVHMYFMKSCKLEIFDKIESLIWIFWKGPSCLIPVKVFSLLHGSMYLDMLFKSLGRRLYSKMHCNNSSDYSGQKITIAFTGNFFF